MRRMTFVLVLIGMSFGGLSTTLGVDPDKDDVTFQAISGVPHCTFDDGQVLMSNASSEWYYKGTYTARAENDGNGNDQCGNDPPGCSSQQCECTLSGSFVLNPDDDREFQTSCVLPNCSGCTKHCDNATANCPDNPTHCTCIYGTFVISHYSDDGDDWIQIPPSFTTPIMENDLERPSVCPTPSECDYD